MGAPRPAERHAVEEHLSGCASCRLRAEEFRALSSVLDDLPAISPSPAFDASLRARIAAEPARRSFWNWMPSPRLAFAVTALVVMSVWLSSVPRVATNPSVVSQAIQSIEEHKVTAESDFGMIRDLPVLENFDVVSKFDALSELPVSPTASNGRREKRNQVMKLRFQFGAVPGRLAGGGTLVRLRVRAKDPTRLLSRRARRRALRRGRKCGPGCRMRCLPRAIRIICRPRRSRGFRTCLRAGRNSSCETTSVS